MHLHEDLPDRRPVLFLDSGEHLQLAAFDVHLQQIDLLQALAFNHSRQCFQLYVDVLVYQPGLHH